MNWKRYIWVIIIVGIGGVSLFFVNKKNDYFMGIIVFTEIPSALKANEWTFPENARIVALHPEKADSTTEILSKGLHSARSPQVSYDGQKIIFSAKKSPEDLWQIWELDLKDLELLRVTNQTSNCTDPVYLPDGKILFSGTFNDKATGLGSALYSCNPDGSGITRITYHPHDDLLPTVSKDGRIITISRQLYPEKQDPKIIAMRPDGTKAELHYKSDDQRISNSRGYETSDGRFVFTEDNLEEDRLGDLVSISQSRPLNSRALIGQGQKSGGYHSPFPISNDQLLVSYLSGDSKTYQLHTYDLNTNTRNSAIYSNPDYHAVEAISVSTREVPRKLPSSVETGKKGKMICMDVNNTDLIAKDAKIRPSLVRVIGVDNTVGSVYPEDDGSFYIEMEPDKPVRFETLDDTGAVLNGPSSWIWVRPNESRGCIGCHEDRELAPGNRVPMAISKDPVPLKMLDSSYGNEIVKR